MTRRLGYRIRSRQYSISTNSWDATLFFPLHPAYLQRASATPRMPKSGAVAPGRPPYGGQPQRLETRPFDPDLIGTQGREDG